ncbi:MAG: response regulator transcription factor [Chitinophagales bacterium]|nr:response regulator transcription factor [Chitinophagales bacterium]
MNNTKILVVDDHPIFINGLIALLKGVEGYEVVDTANNGQAALDKIPTAQPDIILLDINMPILNGVDTMKILKDKFPGIKVIMLTMYNELRLIKELLEIGARGYILKNISREDLLKALDTVISGKPYLDPNVQEKMIQAMAGSDEEKDDAEDAKLVENITTRELEILQLIALGLTSQEISNRLYISKNTVETHRKNLLSKLNVKNTAALLKYAYKHNLV